MEAHQSLQFRDDYCNKKIISLEYLFKRPPIILTGTTTEYFVKLIKEIQNGN